MAVHGLEAQALLGTSVIVVLMAVRRLFVCGVPLVPASQVFCHHGLLNALADLLAAAGSRPVSGWSQRGVRVVRHAVDFVITIVSVHVPVVVRCWARVVGGVDIVVSLHLVFTHVKSS